MYITQLSENREIAPLLRDIFDSDGSEIYLKPAERFIKPDTEIDFYTVLAACAAQAQIAIGYKQTDGKIVVNPIKSTRRKYSAADKIIVIAEEE